MTGGIQGFVNHGHMNVYTRSDASVNDELSRYEKYHKLVEENRNNIHCFKWNNNSCINIPKDILQSNDVYFACSEYNWEPIKMEKCIDGFCLYVVFFDNINEFQYKFIIDDKWYHDPNVNTMDDGYWGKNNVFINKKTTLSDNDYDHLLSNHGCRCYIYYF